MNIDLLDKIDYNKIVYDWNQTDKAYPKDKTIQQLFEEQVQRTPDNIAVVFEEQSLTYQELNIRANQLAHKIRNSYKQQTDTELHPDTLIALCLDRSLEMIVAILAVLKAGGAYVPLDPEYPDERIAYILQDTQAKLLLTQSRHLAKLNQMLNAEAIESFNCINSIVMTVNAEIHDESGNNTLHNEASSKVMLLDITNYSSYQDEGDLELGVTSKSDNLAYVMYTSGTTGMPKGVMIEHRSVCNLLDSLMPVYDLSSDDKVAEFTSYVFDVSVSEIFITLIQGAILHVLANETRKNSELMSNYLKQNGITYCYVPPVLLAQLAQINYPLLKSVIYAGEPCNKLVAKYWSSCLQLHNIYGPTEVTIYATHKQVINSEVEQIGRPLPNTKVYVLDADLQIVPIGVISELYIAGAGLARGYLNNPELTAERFIPNPFATESDIANGYTRMYKTGDLVRWLPDGNLEYIGRNDFQVQIRGFRIELGEIEEQLLRIPQIRQACVVAKTKVETNQQYLAAYYVLNKEVSHGEYLADEEILDKLGLVLPDYMLPSVIMELDSLPLTISGKLDRRALPDVEFTNTSNYVAPESELEQTIAQIWCEVLGLEKVGIHDDFFRCGGNSILAIRLVHQMSQVLDLHLAVVDIFKHKTIQSFIKHLESTTTSQQYIVMSPVSLEHYPLSFAQGRLWFIEQYEAGTNAYHIPMLIELAMNVNVDILKQSIQAIVARHEILRTIFVKNSDGNYYQKVQTAELEISEYNFNDNNVSINFEQQLDLDVNTPFELTTSYPIRVNIYQVKNDCVIGNNNVIVKSQLQQPRHLLLINVHHIASDGWSMDILVKEIYAYYDYFSRPKTKLSLPHLTIQYKDFAYWQRNYLSGNILQQQLNYWQQQLADYEPLVLPTDKVRPALVDYSGKSIRFSLDAECSAKLRLAARAQNCSLYSVLLSGFYVLLSKYSNQDDIVIGTPFANRHYNQIENLIGFFVNTLVLRAKVNPDDSITDLIQQVHHELIYAQGHQDLPFEKLVDHLNVEKDLSRNPIFQVTFGVQYFGKLDAQQQLFKVADIQDLNYNVAKFDLECFMDDSESIISGFFKYATALYEESTIERMIAHYQLVLQQLADEVSQTFDHKQHSQQRKLKDYQLLNQAEYQQIVYDWNQTDKSYPEDKTIHQLFEEQVLRTPDNIAVVFEEQSLTYYELNCRANQLAHKIRNSYRQQTSTELRPDTLIALCLDRSLEMIVAILAVLKAGGAYVPLDPEYPDERIIYILQDTQTKLVLTQTQYIDKLNQIINPVIYADTSVIPAEAGINALNEDNDTLQNVALLDIADYANYQNELNTTLEINTKSNNLAYVIYTSGTTGRPKGVMIEHNGVVNVITFILKKYEIQSLEKILLFANYVFDASVEQIFLAILSSNELVVVDYELIQNPAKLQELISFYGISHLHTTPSYLELLEFSNTTSLKRIIAGGDYVSEQLYNKLLESNRTLINEYGPTETTITATVSINNFSIGNQLDNTRVYVLDQTHTPVPIGVIGELYIAGAGLARGYLNNPELTAGRFIFNPFATESDLANGYTRMYKTGDLVRWLPDGNLEYIGRNDFQVKIRGFRIELGEIEEQLLRIPQIRQACVIAKTKTETNQQYLVAYYVLAPELNSGDCLSADQILVQLSLVLPDYMLPSVLMELALLPLTINGKLDRRALPDIEFTNTSNYVAPESELEQMIAQIWCEVLGLEKVGIHDDFFKLGGHSLNSIQLVMRIRQELNLDLRVADIFIKPTIAKLLTNSRSLIQELDNCYYIDSNRMNQDNVVMVFIPGFDNEFELTYINLVHELHKCRGNMSFYLLKANGEELGDVIMQADHYINQLETLNLFGRRLILCGFSSGGVIAYFMAKQLSKTVKKLILFDSYFYKMSYYDKFKNIVRSSLNMSIYAIPNWKDDLPIINTPILYFRSANERAKLLTEVKYYHLRQLKSNLEYYIDKYIIHAYRLFYKLPNGLTKQMKIKKIHAINAYHYGSDGILTAKYVPKIVQLIQDDIKDI
ncbi:MAG: amino acid adenylation domain-containing protein [Burkholderiales bacterium]|nr:amino acid adenylation domain-containing protein [Burkholderiales bacterium]